MHNVLIPKCVVHNSYHCVLKGISNQYDSGILFFIAPVHLTGCLPTKLCACINVVACFADYTSNPSHSRFFHCFGWHAPSTQFLVAMRNIQCQCAIFLSLTTVMYLVERSCMFRHIILSSSVEFARKS
jgi:hypothetical protein